MDIRSVCVFCGSSLGDDPAYAASAQALGRLPGRTEHPAGLRRGLHRRHGRRGRRSPGRRRRGRRRHPRHPSAQGDDAPRTDRVPAGRVHARAQGDHGRTLRRLHGHLPGGLGTLEEAFEILTWSTLGIHRKPCGFVNVGGYYGHLERFLDHVAASQFLRREYRDIVLFEPDPAAMLARMRGYEPWWRSGWTSRRADRRQ